MNAAPTAFIKMHHKGPSSEYSTTGVHLNTAQERRIAGCSIKGYLLHIATQGVHLKAAQPESRTRGALEGLYLHTRILTDADDPVLVGVDDSPVVGLSPPHHLSHM